MPFKRLNEDDEITTNEGNEFEALLNESFKGNIQKLSIGQKIKAEVLSVGKEQTIVTTGTIHDGFVPTAHLTDASGNISVKAGDKIDLYVTFVRGSEILLSPNPTAKNLANDIQDAYEKGLVIEGRVESLNKGGFQVTIMGKAAFCPISQMDTRHVDKPELYLGKKFEFKISQFAEGGRNIVVSRRRVLEQTQEIERSKFLSERKIGDIVSGTVTRFESFGAFVEILPGIEALAHISEISWERIKEPKDVLEIGQSVSAKILKMDRSDGRLKISVSLKNSDLEPWQNLPKEIQPGNIVSGTITRCAPFGAFVSLAPGIEGLIPLSEMSYTKRVSKGDEIVKPGERVSVKIKDIDTQAKRISLSLKEAGENPKDIEDKEFQDYKKDVLAKSSLGSFGSLGGKLAAALDKKQKP